MSLVQAVFEKILDKKNGQYSSVSKLFEISNEKMKSVDFKFLVCM